MKLAFYRGTRSPALYLPTLFFLCLQLFSVNQLYAKNSIPDLYRSTMKVSSIQAKLAKVDKLQLRNSIKDALLQSDKAIAIEKLQILIGKSSDLIQKEFTIQQILFALMQVPETTELRQFVSGYRQYDNQIFQKHDEGPLPVASFNIREKAQAVLLAWLKTSVKEQVVHNFVDGTDPLRSLIAQLEHNQWKQQKFAVTAGVIKAVWLVDEALLRSQILNWRNNFKTHALYQQGLVNSALRLNDENLMMEMLNKADQVNLSITLQKLPQYFDETTTIRLIVSAINNKQIASQALYALGHYLPNHSELKSFMMDKLFDKASGGTAAAVIAKNADDKIMHQLSRSLASTQNKTHAARILLTLKLINTFESKQLIENFIEQGSHPFASLQQEVKQWLVK